MMSTAFISSLFKQKSIWTVILALLVFFLGGFYINVRYENQINDIKEKSTRREYLSISNVKKVVLQASASDNSDEKMYRVDVDFSASEKDVVVELNQYSVAFTSEIKDGDLVLRFRELKNSEGWRAMYQDQVKVILPTLMSDVSVKGFSGTEVSAENLEKITLVNIHLLDCENQLSIGKIQAQKMLVQRQCDAMLRENRYGASIDVQQRADIDFLEITSPTGSINIDDASRVDQLTLYVGGLVSITAPAQLLQKANLQTGATANAPQ